MPKLFITIPQVTLEGDTLGKKRKHFNKLVEDAVANKHYELSKISSDDRDIDKLFKIAIASKTRHVDYIIEVMKSDDMLYAATAIKQSTWLITEEQYAHIINPEYLHTQLLPSMNTKIFNKLMLHIRLNLKSESRVEAFYEYLKETDHSHKWLERCSNSFIEKVIKKERLIPLSLFKRLCRRSAHFIPYYKRIDSCDMEDLKNETLFLLKSHTADVLSILEYKDYDNLPELGSKKTELLMKSFPQRILDNFDKYANKIDLSVVAKYLKKEEIKPFIFQQMKKLGDFFSKCENLSYFVKNMAEKEKLDFIYQTFIDRTDLSFLQSEDGKDEYGMDLMFYYWYNYVPFDIAFPALKKLILAENSPTGRCAILSIMITCARKNPQHFKLLLIFFYERHINELFKFKIQFVNYLLSQITPHELDVESWNHLDQLFYSMEVYTESENDVQLCLEFIVLYKVLHDEHVPAIVEHKIKFNTFENHRETLSQEQNDKIFTYLLNFLQKQIQSNNIANKSDFNNTLQQLNNILTLLRDWKQDISCYPFILEKIQELVNINEQNLWEIDLSNLYNIKKSWRKHMFEQSLSLCLCEEACLNALKHKPQLLTLHDKEIESLRTNDAVSLKRLIAKLRVYWPDSLAQHWTDAYMRNLNKPTGQKAVFKGLFALLPQNLLIDMAKKHVPENFKINQGELDQTKIYTRKNIAKYLHLSRPFIPFETVLWYANGDYLQYAVPSLNAISSKMSQVESSKHILKLLEASMTLRKLGVNLAFSKLKPSELKTIIPEIWDTTTNSKIRSLIFRNTYTKLCNIKITTVEKELWAILSMFIDQLPLRINKKINLCLGEVENVPLGVRAEFYMKSYTYLTSLPGSAEGDKLISHLVSYARDTSPNIVESFDDDFVTDKLLYPVEAKFYILDSEFIAIFGRYVLWGKSEEVQLRRFRSVVEPAMKDAFLFRRRMYSDDYYVKKNFNQFILYLIKNYKDFTLSRRTIPTKLFTEIKNKMEQNILENYVLYTSWKLVTVYATLMEQHISEMGSAWLTDKKNKVWNKIHVAMFPDLGSKIVSCLKEDAEQYSPSICFLFTDALQIMIDGIFSCDSKFKLEILKHMLNDNYFAPSYVVVSRATIKDINITNDLKRMRTVIRKKIQSHPSQEVQMHYHNDFKGLPLDELEEQNNGARQHETCEHIIL